jgi:hypothetical protein
VVAALPAACRALDAQHVELSDETTDRSIAGHASILGARRRPTNYNIPTMLRQARTVWCCQPMPILPLGVTGESPMHKMLLPIVAVALLLPNGATFAAESPDVVACSRFVEHGGMGQPVDKGRAQTMCEDSAYRAKVLKAKGSGK